MIWMIVLGLLALLWLADGLKLRRRLSDIPVLRSRPNGVPDDDAVLATAKGVTCDPATRHAAVVHLREEGLEVLDLVPADAPLSRLLLFLGTVERSQLRRDPVALGRSAGYAVLVSRALLGRVPAGLANPPASSLELLQWVRDLKRYAP